MHFVMPLIGDELRRVAAAVADRFPQAGRLRRLDAGAADFSTSRPLTPTPDRAASRRRDGNAGRATGSDSPRSFASRSFVTFDVCRYVADVTKRFIIFFMSQPSSMNCTASQSSSSRMAGRLALRAEILRRFDETGAETLAATDD